MPPSAFDDLAIELRDLRASCVGGAGAASSSAALARRLASLPVTQRRLNCWASVSPLWSTTCRRPLSCGLLARLDQLLKNVLICVERSCPLSALNVVSTCAEPLLRWWSAAWLSLTLPRRRAVERLVDLPLDAGEIDAGADEHARAGSAGHRLGVSVGTWRV